jgi:hypothetical protein
MPARHFVRIDAVGEVTGHQRGEARARRQRLDDPVAIGLRGRDFGDRRRQIGHDDRARELRGRVGGHRSQHLAVAQMHVPVVRAADGEGLDHPPK